MLGRIWNYRAEWRGEAVALVVAVFFALFCNRSFWQAVTDNTGGVGHGNWLLLATLFIALVALGYILLGLVLTRWTMRPVLALLLVATALAVHFMEQYRVFLDPAMLRNALATDPGEARDLINWSLARDLILYAGIPLWLLSRIRIRLPSWPRAIGFRLATLAAALVVSGGALLLSYQDLAPLMRNHKEVRYLLTPANYLYALARVSFARADAAEAVRAPVATDATPGAGWAQRQKPVVLVMVLGETARAANWQLSGYTRPTTPELAARDDLINFAAVTSCGTDTETSLPCIFSPWGRAQYDEKRIRGSESLLDVAARAGFRVVWIDNQSGCKGVCAGVEAVRPDPAMPGGLCQDGQCQDGALVETLARTMADSTGNLLVIMHQMGNHGPAYFKRYPPAFAHFTPACNDIDLSRCPREEIVNAYDNALRYTDHVLAATIGLLAGQDARDAAMLYVSDHGESLGENGLFLHGIPYAIAPDVQTRVPMVLWLSPGYARSFATNPACVAERAQKPATHDHLFHTILGMLDIRTATYSAGMDLVADCRKS
jgi:lipid A ethanolaminephosphotransferase